MTGNKTLEQKKLNSAIVGDGAEFYVASQLMLNDGLIVSMAPKSAPGWDLEVTSPITGKSAKIQVKFRTTNPNDSSHLRLRNALNFDFLVLVESPLEQSVNIQIKRVRAKDTDANAIVPVFPVWIIGRTDMEHLIYESSNKSKGFMVKNFRTPDYQFNWGVISDYLSH